MNEPQTITLSTRGIELEGEADRRPLVEQPGEIAVERVGQQRATAEDHQGRPVPPVRHQRAEDDNGQAQPAQGQDVRDVPERLDAWLLK